MNEMGIAWIAGGAILGMAVVAVLRKGWKGALLGAVVGAAIGTILYFGIR